MVDVYDQDQDVEMVTGIVFEEGMTTAEILAKLNDSSGYAEDAIEYGLELMDSDIVGLGWKVWLERQEQIAVFGEMPLVGEVVVHERTAGVICREMGV